MKIRTSFKAILILAGALFLLFNPVSSKADAIYTIGAPNSAISPYPAPYATLDVALDVTGKIATFTFNYASTGGYTYLMQDSKSADVNLNKSGGGTFTAAFVSATGPSTGGFNAPIPNTPPPPGAPWGSGNVDGFGTFNLTFDLFDGTKGPATQIVYEVTSSIGWADASSVLTPNANNYLAAIHVVVFNSTDVVNGHQLATGYAAVPEPGILILLGIAMTAIGVAARFVRKI